MRASLISAAFVAALVGYGSTIALVLAAAAAVGATDAQVASWILAVCLARRSARPCCRPGTECRWCWPGQRRARRWWPPPPGFGSNRRSGPSC
ncbi:MAG: hypothetical protein R3D63_02300 [Paracoccaceae bacterium]